MQDMTTKQLIEIHNNVAPKPISSWKQAKSKLIARIEEYKNDDPLAEVLAAEHDTIRSFSEALLMTVVDIENDRRVGLSYKEILELVLKRFPNANTTVKCLRWYNTKLREDVDMLKAMPASRPRSRWN